MLACPKKIYFRPQFVDTWFKESFGNWNIVDKKSVKIDFLQIKLCNVVIQSECKTLIFREPVPVLETAGGSHCIIILKQWEPWDSWVCFFETLQFHQNLWSLSKYFLSSRLRTSIMHGAGIKKHRVTEPKCFDKMPRKPQLFFIICHYFIIIITIVNITS